jgi:CRISPR/Cas system-associated protein Cas10 (large subunit of type III CRISPR-Cas system)
LCGGGGKTDPRQQYILLARARKYQKVSQRQREEDDMTEVATPTINNRPPYILSQLFHIARERRNAIRTHQ